MYHNTTDSTGADLLDYRVHAKNQDQIIHEYFRRNDPWLAKGLTASEVLAAMLRVKLMHNTPITSIRRALTNLTTSNKLVKTDDQRDGPFGRPEYVYKLATGQLRLV
jgi:hypothetical protein